MPPSLPLPSPLPRLHHNSIWKQKLPQEKGRKYICGKFTEIKQVSARSIQVCWDQCLEHFCSQGRTCLHYRKVGEIPGYEWAHLPCWETACYQLQQQTKVHVFALVQQTLLKNYTKSTHKGCSTWNQMITSSNCTWACPISPEPAQVWWERHMIPSHSYNFLPIRRVPSLPTSS